MRASPKVSVVIPTHNRAPVLVRAIESALRQSMSDLEVIVVDDASSDDTADRVGEIRDERIVYLRHERNLFAAAARNTGMAAARGQFVAFLDSDDAWTDNHVELQLRALASRSEDWACVHGGARLYKNGNDTPVLSLARYEGNVLREYVMAGFAIWTPTFMFRRACLDEIGMMDVSLRRGQDRDFYIRMLQHYKLARVEEPITNVYMETDKQLADVSGVSRTRLLEKHDALLRSLGWPVRRRAWAMQRMLQAEAYFSEGRTREGLTWFFKSVIDFPLLPPRRYLAAGYKLWRSLVASRSESA